MEDIKCKNCKVEFTSSNVPKVLHCGHSFCVKCISTIQDRICLACSFVCNESELNNPPTNYTLLVTIRNLNFTRSLLSRFAVIQELISKTRKGMKSIAPFNQYYELIDFDSLNLHEITNLISNPFQPVMLYKFDVQVSLQAKDFKHVKYFLSTIVDFLNKGCIFYAAQKVDNKILYGKLSLHGEWENTLFIHALTEEGHEIGANIIWFQDITDSPRCPYLMTFIEIPYLLTMKERIVFKMDDVSLATQFAEKCVGEGGATYKGLFYNTEIVEDTDEIGRLNLNGYKIDNRWTTYLLDYNLGLHVKPKAFKNCFALQGLNNGGFNIIRCSVKDVNVLDNIIGQMHNFCSEKEGILGFKSNERERKNMILDCGIAIPTGDRMQK